MDLRRGVSQVTRQSSAILLSVLASKQLNNSCLTLALTLALAIQSALISAHKKAAVLREEVMDVGGGEAGGIPLQITGEMAVLIFQHIGLGREC